MKPGIIVLLMVALVAVGAWCWHPVCEPLSREVQASFRPRRVEERTDERMWGVQVFQKRDGQWCQCKPWLARQMFF